MGEASSRMLVMTEGIRGIDIHYTGIIEEFI